MGRSQRKSWWSRLSAGQRVAMSTAAIGAAAVLLAAGVQAYGSIHAAGISPPPPTTSPPKGASVLTSADYFWTEDSAMWAFPQPLPSAVEQTLQQRQGSLEAIQSEVEGHGGVKIAGLDLSALGKDEFSQVKVTVTGNHTTQVTITSMRARVLRREKPISETLVYAPPQAENPTIDLAFALDSLNPIARRMNQQGAPGEPYFAKKFVTLKRDETAVFNIRAYTSRCYCEWEIEVDTNVDGKPQPPLFIRDKDGNPFRTTAFSPSYQTIYAFDFATGSFVREPSGTPFPPS
jgi:hypothetical protein